MNKKTMLVTCVIAATMAALVACGVSKADYDKVSTELQQVTQEKAALTDQLVKDKEQLAQLQSEVAALTKENVELKAQLATQKPAAKPTKTK